MLPKVSERQKNEWMTFLHWTLSDNTIVLSEATISSTLRAVSLSLSNSLLQLSSSVLLLQLFKWICDHENRKHVFEIGLKA